MSTVDPNILTAYNEQLDLEVDTIKSKVDLLSRQAKIQHFSSLQEIGLDNSATLIDIALSLPFDSVLRFDAFSGDQTNLELPKNFNGERISGQLIAANHGRSEKCYFYWQNEKYSAHAMYNEFGGPSGPVFDWIFSREYFSIPITASEYSNSLANVAQTGLYYYNSTEAGNFNDSPVTAGSFLKVISQTDDQNPGVGSFIQEVTRNSATLLEIYRRQVSSGTVGSWIQHH